MSAIIVNFNSGNDLRRCVASIESQGCAIEVIVVDNGSQDGSVARAQADHPEIRVLPLLVNDGFAGGVNRGAEVASTDILFVLNPDVTLEPGCAVALINAIELGHVGAVLAPVIVEASGHVVDSGFTIDYMGDLIALPSLGKPLFVSGCALATTRNTFNDLGGFDAGFFMFCEDLDFCWRALLRGHAVDVIPAARVRHQGGGSTPGGYVSRGRLEVTAFRISLRERNTLATLVRCGPAAWVVLVVALRLARMGIIALVAAAHRRPDVARLLVKGVAWNIRRFPQLVRQRKAMGATPALRRKILRDRIHRDASQLRALLKHGLPQFVDRKGPPPDEA